MNTAFLGAHAILNTFLHIHFISEANLRISKIWRWTNEWTNDLFELVCSVTYSAKFDECDIKRNLKNTDQKLKETFRFLTCRLPKQELVYWKLERRGTGSHSTTSHSRYLENKTPYKSVEPVHFCQEIADILRNTFCTGTSPKVYI